MSRVSIARAGGARGGSKGREPSPPRDGRGTASTPDPSPKKGGGRRGDTTAAGLLTQLIARLERALSPRDALYALREVGLTDEEVATGVGLSNSGTVRRWRATQGPRPRAHYVRGIDNLRSIALRLLRGDVFTNPGDVGGFLRSRSTYLGDQRPIDVVAEDGGYERVRDAVDAFLAPGLPAPLGTAQQRQASAHQRTPGRS